MKVIDKNYMFQLAKRPDRCHKGDFGRVLIIAGSFEMGGAALMAAKSCLYSGAGLVTLATDKENIPVAHASLPEIMGLDYQDSGLLKKAIEKADTVLIGPGLGRTAFAKSLFTCCLQQITQKQKLVIDADALTLLSFMIKRGEDYPLRAAMTVLTPHAKEWERLSGLSLSEQSDKNNQAVYKEIFPSTTYVLVKSHESRLYHDSDPVVHVKIGNPGMAIAGMGDTLSGIVAAFISQKSYLHPTDAVTDAIFLHSYIGDILAQSQYIVLPSRLSELIPETIHHLISQKI